MEQLTMFEMPRTQGKENKLKRKWENAFQKWSDENSMEGTDCYGCCGFGSMCDWCEDNTYGRPCVRALNAMCREEGIDLDYTDTNFKRIWAFKKELKKRGG